MEKMKAQLETAGDSDAALSSVLREFSENSVLAVEERRLSAALTKFLHWALAPVDQPQKKKDLRP